MEGIILVSNVSAICLIDSYSTHSFVAFHFAPKLRVVGLSVSTCGCNFRHGSCIKRLYHWCRG